MGLAQEDKENSVDISGDKINMGFFTFRINQSDNQCHELWQNLLPTNLTKVAIDSKAKPEATEKQSIL